MMDVLPVMSLGLVQLQVLGVGHYQAGKELSGLKSGLDYYMKIQQPIKPVIPMLADKESEILLNLLVYLFRLTIIL